jgi:putative membrane protein
VRRFLLAWGVGAISLYLVSLLLGSRLEIGSFWDVVWASLLLGLLNAVLAPLLNLLTCPLYLLTLGLSRFLVTGALILLADWAIPGFEVAGFLWAVLAAILISITTTFLSTQVRGGEGGRGR